MSDAVLRCRLCSASPALQVTVHEHHGMVVLMQHVRYRGPFCRTCGERVVARATKRTLMMGWWGMISVFVTPITLLLDMRVRSKLRGLPEPAAATQPAAPAAAAAATPPPPPPSAAAAATPPPPPPSAAEAAEPERSEAAS